MAFGRDNIHTVSVCISDPTADVSMPIFRVPSEMTKIELLEAHIVMDTTKAAGTQHGISVTLLDGGTDGTGTAALTNTLGGTDAGGTFPAWTAVTPQSWTVSEGTLDATDWIVLKYDEAALATAAPLNTIVTFSYVSGVGA